MSATRVGPRARALTVFVVAGLCLAGGSAAPPSAASAAPEKAAEVKKGKRSVYFVEHGSAKELAVALGKHFKADIEVHAVADGPKPCLLITCPPDSVREILALLHELDAPPRLVEVEVLIAEVVPKKGGGKPDE